jgi:hypothetical protein
MSEKTISFVESLVERFPHLSAIFEEHVSDNFGEVLPHLFFGDLTLYAVGLFLQVQDRNGLANAQRELKDLLDVLEEAFRQGDQEIVELISDSFLEHLPRPREERGWEIRSLVGPKLRKQLEVIG